MTVRRRGALLWLVLTLLALGAIAWRWQGGVPLETDILTLFPQESATAARARWIASAETGLHRALTETVTLALGAPRFETAAAAARQIRRALTDAELIRREKQATSGGSDAGSGEPMHRLGAWLHAHRSGLLAPEDRRDLLAGRIDPVLARARARLITPFGFSAGGAALLQDPFQLFPAYLTALPLGNARLGNARLGQRDGLTVAETDGRVWVILSLPLAGAPFERRFQDAFLARLTPLIDRLQADSGGTLRIVKTGALFYAADSARRAQREATGIGLLSTLGVIALCLALFRHWRPLALGGLVIASGLLSGVAAGLVLFGRLHLISLSFTAALAGITIDYAFHYFAERLHPAVDRPEEAARRVRPGLTLGMASSVAGFLALGLTPFAGLQQIAVICAAGLAMAWLCVLSVFPPLDRLPASRPPLSGLQRLALDGAGRVRSLWQPSPGARHVLGGGALVILLLAMAGWPYLRPVDDIRDYAALSSELQAEEAQIRALTGIDQATRALLVSAPSAEAALQLEEEIIPTLDTLRAAGKLRHYLAWSRFVPSRRRQQENRALVAEHLEAPHRAAFLQALGAETIAPPPAATPLLRIEARPATTDLPMLQRLTLETGGDRVVHLVLLFGLEDAPALQDRIQEKDGLFLVDRAGDISRVLAANRLRALQLLAGAILIIAGLLSRRYGVTGALQIIAVPVTALTLALPLAALAGAGLTFFSVMALILVFAIGLDYALFAAEAGRMPCTCTPTSASTSASTSALAPIGGSPGARPVGPKPVGPRPVGPRPVGHAGGLDRDHGAGCDRHQSMQVTALANALSALSTILAFGLLSLSSMLVVKSFGLIMLFGIPLAFLLSPIAEPANPSPAALSRTKAGDIRGP